MPKVLKLHSQLLFCSIYYALKVSIVIDELPVAVKILCSMCNPVCQINPV